MVRKLPNTFIAITVEGSLIPADFLRRIAVMDREISHLTPTSYGLAESEKVNEAIGRSWSRLLGIWSAFREKKGSLPDNDLGTGITRAGWLTHLFHELGYPKLTTAQIQIIEEKRYPVAHIHEHLPIHTVSFRAGLDERSERHAGARNMSPHSMMQEFLNRNDNHLWGMVTNGLQLRLLRDNASFSRQAFIEFDVETIFNDSLFPEFAVLWLICHESRYTGDSPEKSLIEQWARAAQEHGIRALETLKESVKQSIEHIGRGFIAESSNGVLRDSLRSGALSKNDYYRELLRIIYRCIFLFVAEDRNLLLAPDTITPVRERYYRFYSLSRLRDLSLKLKGTHHRDMWKGLYIVFQKLHAGAPELGLPALGSFLWAPQAIAHLSDANISNRSLLDALRSLAFTMQQNTRRLIDYRNIGAEELGSIYESLLEMDPDLNIDEKTFTLKVRPGNERKTSGSYYTPSSLINSLLDTALEPKLAEAMNKAEPEKAILALKVCDPAAGSGHFLVSAAHRMAKRLAQVRTGVDEPVPEAQRKALRDVIGHCIYGVDINPMSVELCKVSLWMEALEPGRPLSFLDHHIKCGNSLIGTTPKLMKEGIPDAAFSPIEGDEKTVCTEYKKKNKKGQKGQTGLFSPDGKSYFMVSNLHQDSQHLDLVDDSNIEGVTEKQKRYESIISSEGYRYARRYADAWCSAFVWRKVVERDVEGRVVFWPLTNDEFNKMEYNPTYIPEWMGQEIDRLSAEFQFFHWHLEFPDVFWVPGGSEPIENEQQGWNGGFDVMLGNPPWEHTELKEKEWFATRDSRIANARTGAERKRMIDALKHENPALHAAFIEVVRSHDGVSLFLGNSGNYPLCGRGRINTYAIFAELIYRLRSTVGTAGFIVPSGVATDDTTKFFFQELVDTHSLCSFYDFENREAIFPGVHRSYKFALVTMKAEVPSADFVFFALNIDDLKDKDKHFTLSAKEIALINPNTRTCPIFRSKRDAEITKAVYRRVPVLIDENKSDGNPWGISFKQGLFNMTSDSHLFKPKEQMEEMGFVLEGNIFVKGEERYLPLYEAKMIHHFDHRWATYEGEDTRDLTMTEKQDPNFLVLPRYWVAENEVDAATANYSARYFLAFRDITNTTNERTSIFSLMPKVAVGNNAPLALLASIYHHLCFLCGSSLTSFVFDFFARVSVGGTHMNFYILKQLPVLPASVYSDAHSAFISVRALELYYTAMDMKPFAEDMGYVGAPFKWNEERRFMMRCELDALYFHLYGINRGDADYIMETFPIVKRKDLEQHGTYRTKDIILAIYDQMTNGIENYRSPLDPPAGDPRAAHQH